MQLATACCSWRLLLLLLLLLTPLLLEAADDEVNLKRLASLVKDASLTKAENKKEAFLLLKSLAAAGGHDAAVQEAAAAVFDAIGADSSVTTEIRDAALDDTATLASESAPEGTSFLWLRERKRPPQRAAVILPGGKRLQSRDVPLESGRKVSELHIAAVTCEDAGSTFAYWALKPDNTINWRRYELRVPFC